MPILDHFGLIAPFYDRVIGYRAFEKLIALVDLPIDGRLLDAGGGTRRVTQTMMGMENQLVVVDISQGMLQQALAKSQLEPVCSLTERLPFPGGSFERVIMVDALHHVYSHQATAAELWRVLTPGGRIVIEEPDIRTFPVKLVAAGEKLAMMRSHFISPPEIAAVFQKFGAQVRLDIDGVNAWIVVMKTKAS
jgi:ubiquinone/menaquinone biosynthesis C-methylase UbiE